MDANADPLAILKRLQAFIALITAAGAVLILIYLGLRYFTAKGEVSKTHEYLKYVLLGLVLLSLAATIPTLLLSFLGQRLPNQ